LNSDCAIRWPPGERFWNAPVDEEVVRVLVPALVCVPVTVDMLCVPVPVDPCWVPAELVSLLMLAGGIAFDWAQAGAVNAKAAPNTRQALCSFMTDSSWCSRAVFSGPSGRFPRRRQQPRKPLDQYKHRFAEGPHLARQPTGEPRSTSSVKSLNLGQLWEAQGGDAGP